ncbi:MAG: hypothetical protein QNJ47_09215 [Nostocaceae cyanobacterium]|nr:hypothetical protein [Nostocaceae cyanobacterium]
MTDKYSQVTRFGNLGERLGCVMGFLCSTVTLTVVGIAIPWRDED